MSAFSHLRDPQTESILDDLEEIKALAETLNPTRELLSMFDAICRPEIRSTAKNTRIQDQIGEAAVMGDDE